MNAPTLVSTLEAALERAAAVRPAADGFPHFAEALRQAGITRYRTHTASNTSLYAMGGDVVLRQGDPPRRGTFAVAPYDEAALVEVIQADRAGTLTYTQLLEGVLGAGIVAWGLDLAERTCTYDAVDGPRYVESYRAVAL
jgi:uncharacterized protein YbcV (DUF1398 family)